MNYDIDYFEGLLKQNSSTAKEICEIRWEFIDVVRPTTVLDYGSGVGWFRAFRPSNVAVDSYDIAEYPQTGINHKEYDVICFWDVFEHIPDIHEVENLIVKCRHVALAMPIKPDGIEWKEWKHFKPREHLHYFDEDLLDAMFASLGFKKLKSGTPECPPRKDILSVLYERRE